MNASLLTAVVLGACTPSGHVEYTLDGNTTESVAATASSRQEGYPLEYHVLIWRAPDDNHTIIDVTSPPSPGSYDCAQMGGGAVAVYVDPWVSAYWQTEGSTCSITWDRRNKRMVGTFTAHAGVFAKPEQPFVDVSGDFDVDEPPR